MAHTESRGKTHYRVDRMAEIQLTGTPRLCPEQYQELNLAAYSRQVFGMFGGSETRVRLQFPRSLINNAVDKFGSSAMMIPQQDGSVTVSGVLFLGVQLFRQSENSGAGGGAAGISGYVPQGAGRILIDKNSLHGKTE